MRDAQATTIYLKDYQVPTFLIDRTQLRFELEETQTRVISRLSMRRNPDLIGNTGNTLRLDGQDMTLVSVSLNGQALSAEQYQVDDESLVIANISALLDQSPEQGFELSCETLIKPQENTSLEGLYKSHTMFCTQCEAEGFRKITYYLDRPDVMAMFETTIVADKRRYPVLLSNGNAIKQGELDDGRHWVTWEDPFRKPCYLFALVAGDLKSIEDRFTTQSGRDVMLRIFVEEKDLDKCDHAMQSLKNAMRWDEQVYGREYDLDIFMIVAVDDFNMGAMENKGLNIFNTSCVLAKPETTTDTAFQRVEAVVAHEYFHNWSGNRVTCRDWFQLSLKEGFTVFRDAEFSADMGSRTVKRVEDVTFLRTAQFAEDAGPMSHPVRPDSYMEISNFYTLTIYEKGAEVVRMIRELVGEENFRKGSDLYFERHDGQAVTTEDFVRAMEEASGVDLQQFRRWYTQSGTPVMHVSGHYNEPAQTYELSLSQSCPPTPGQPHKEPFHIPLRMGLLGAGGNELELNLPGEKHSGLTERVLNVTEPVQRFVFHNIPAAPVPSLLRGFSAPVKLHADLDRDQLMFLMTRDSDGFNRWNASQELAVGVMQEMLASHQQGGEMVMDSRLSVAVGEVLQHAVADAQGANELDQAMLAQLLSLPSEAYLSELAEEIDVDGIHAVREHVADALAAEHAAAFAQLYQLCQSDEPYRADAAGIARRSLKNLSLAYLMRLPEPKPLDVCFEQFTGAGNMTDVDAALRLLVNSRQPQAAALAEKALADFYAKWRHESLVVNQWFTVQATASRQGTLQQVKALMEHEAFDIRNPNKVRSLIGAFSNGNPVNFHDLSGEGYQFLAEQILQLDGLNPQIAARLLTPLTRWRRYGAQRQKLMKAELERIAAQADLSRDVYEVVSKSLSAS
ncbi:aminopeptidase N [Pseudohongiella spirulinae]|uniref:Aminopeptidase N n=1 Tax=Pseudohongiella spirulinae TaxID=1249552 RepID=A0A0S2KE15_9GAMM|nr:aminopeptidase N [Pseudohongiella spirulinae]ALO46538.1 aminopeptidase N [Pseudohongiella spirulinae]